MVVAMQVILVFVVSTMLHEVGHALAAMLQGYKLKKFYLGIPVEFQLFGRKWSATLYKKQFGTVEFGISAIIFGGAVDFYDLDDAPFKKKFWVMIAGPLVNLIIGFVPLLFFFDLTTSFRIAFMVCGVVLSALGQLVSGRLPLSQVVGPVGVVKAMVGFANGYSNGLVLLLVILNLAFFISNIIPIPALDGGQIMTSAVVAIFGEKAKKPMDRLTLVFFYCFVVVMAIILTKDLW